MAAPALVTLLFDALVATSKDGRASGRLATDLAKELAHKVIVIDPDELHVVDITPDGGWTMGHPVSCRPNLFSCPFQAAAITGFTAPGPGRYTVVIEEDQLEIANKVS